ncbi:MAG: glycosyl transferase family 9 [Hydrogenophilales bacterium CG17_big_fil_post_rev_8_21_14_2_50_63_12]|nr:MAG: glycosyl transferase family 9 [Hydrogenophilales bacterium CG17_big_fil_post_rev_8_21_14_2_50_63_12]
MNDQAPRILLIRRDNIGDLACTTPLFSALRQRYPNAYLCALVTSYNRAVLDHHPALDKVFAYTKAKHLDAGESVIACHLNRLRLLLALRREHFDYCVLAAPGYQKRALTLARWVAARHVIGFVEEGKPHAALIDRPVPWHFDPTQSETEDVCGLAHAFAIEVPPGKQMVRPAPQAVTNLLPEVAPIRALGGRVVGIHLSARKPSQRWPSLRFVELMRRLRHEHGCPFMLLWSPGTADTPRHPGDDAKAAEVLAACADLPVLAVPTQALEQLIAAISLCDDFICADGGAMHLAAATGKPIVCLFGHSDTARWRPWGVPYRLLQAPSRDVKDIGTDEVVAAYTVLRKEQEHASP